jgi:hypothetical protein
MGIYFSFEDLLKNLNPEKREEAPPSPVVRLNLPLGPPALRRRALRVSVTDEFWF